jgi:hypothetical protein
MEFDGSPFKSIFSSSAVDSMSWKLVHIVGAFAVPAKNRARATHSLEVGPLLCYC